MGASGDDVGGLTAFERRLRETEALNLLTNRVLMDYLSLQIDAGAMTLDSVKRLVGFSATEVLRGSPGYETEVRFLEQVLVQRFNDTFPPTDGAQ